MAQYATPSADIFDGAWLDQGASAVDMYLDIVPIVPGAIDGSDDATYIESELNPTNSPVSFELSDIEDPVSSTGHIMRWRRQKDAAAGGQMDLTVELRRAYTGEGGMGTLINTYADSDIPAAWATASDTLTGGEADAILDYTDLQLRMLANQST